MTQTAPYQDLYIYYLTGRISGEPRIVHPDLIGDWEEEGDTFLFFHRPADDWVRGLLGRQSGVTLADQFKMSYAEWQGGQIEPLQVGRLIILPAWQAPQSPPSAGTILLDPGVVFGTGTHPTTAHCLEALQLAFADAPFDRVLDIGTGTGLLALAAARLGANRVVAVDLNQLAVETARHNVVRNGLARKIVVIKGNAKNFIDLACDLVVSNIHYEVMRQLIAEPGFQSQRRFILSGLLRSQARRIEDELLRRSMRIVRRWEQDAVWFTFYGRKE